MQNIQNVTSILNIFEQMPECNFANHSHKIPFITHEITFIKKQRIYEMYILINRGFHVSKLMNCLIYPLHAILIEASIFEFALTYADDKQMSNNLFLSVYNDKFDSIHDHINSQSHLYNKTLLTDIEEIQRVAFLTPQELNKQKWTAVIDKYALREEKRKNITTTDLYQCFKCKERKCQITEQQTRSADEPITKFITCLVCGNVFKK